MIKAIWLLAAALISLLGSLVGGRFLVGPAVPVPPPAAASATQAAALPTLPPAAPLERSRPTWLKAPLLGRVDGIVDLELKADRSLQVPPTAGQVGWYAGGASPGERGPAVLVGHVTWGRRPAVFYPLARLKPGQLVEVGRADGRVVTFRVRSVESLPKDRFPTERMYGPTPVPELRIVTCGGRWNGKSYPDNIVAFAEMVGDGSTTRKGEEVTR